MRRQRQSAGPRPPGRAATSGSTRSPSRPLHGARRRGGRARALRRTPPRARGAAARRARHPDGGQAAGHRLSRRRDPDGAAEGRTPGAVAVMLEHRDPALSVPLFAPDGTTSSPNGSRGPRARACRCWWPTPTALARTVRPHRRTARRAAPGGGAGATRSSSAGRPFCCGEAGPPVATRRASRRARDHRAELSRTSRSAMPQPAGECAERANASSTRAANRISPASRFDLNSRRHSAGSSMSRRPICQARCAAKATSPSANTMPAPALQPASADQHAPPARRTPPASAWCARRTAARST